MVRIVLILLGVGALGAAGYLGWLRQDEIPQLARLDLQNLSVELLAAAGGGLLGLVLIMAGLLTRATSREQREAEAARRAEAIREAEAYYSQKASDPDRDWRTQGLPPEAPPAASTPAPPRPAPAAMSAPPEAAPAPSTAAPAKPFPAPVPPKPIPAAEADAAPPPQAATPAAPPAPQAAPAQGNGALAHGAPLAGHMIPTAAPAVTQAPAMPAAAPDASGPFPEIRKALAEKRLEDADRLLNEQRARLQSSGDAESLELAELTSLAGDHAAAAGRLGGAKWLWRLALQRFGAANALASPSARAVSERLRLSDQ